MRRKGRFAWWGRHACLLSLLVPMAACGADGGTALRLDLVDTFIVMPDASYHWGGFVRINYVPATDRLLVTFGAQSTTASEGEGFVYKEYTADMVETGTTGRFLWNQQGDMGSAMVDNTYYFVTFPLFPDDGPTNGLRVRKYDATTMTKLADTFFALPGDGKTYPNNDPMVAWVNGRLDVSCQYNPSGSLPDLLEGTGTYHRFFDAELATLDERWLTDTPHIAGSSMVYVDGIYYLVSSASFLGGDLKVMKYDASWHFLGSKDLGVGQAHWSTGLVHDGGRFYVAYLDNSQWAFPAPKYFPIYLNAHVAVFDADWNRLADVAATSFGPANSKAAGRPWVLLHDKRVYVAYDVDAIDPNQTPAEKHEGEAWITVYDLVGDGS